MTPFGRYLNQSASQLISGITGNVYDSLSVDQNLNIFLNTSRKLIPIEQAVPAPWTSILCTAPRRRGFVAIRQQLTAAPTGRQLCQL